MSKKRAKTKRTVGRREFMQGVLVGGSAVAVTLAAGKASAETTAPEPERDKTAVAAGYTETAHVREYYKTVAE